MHNSCTGIKVVVTLATDSEALDELELTRHDRKLSGSPPGRQNNEMEAMKNKKGMRRENPSGGGRVAAPLPSSFVPREKTSRRRGPADCDDP